MIRRVGRTSRPARALGAEGSWKDRKSIPPCKNRGKSTCSARIGRMEGSFLFFQLNQKKKKEGGEHGEELPQFILPSFQTPWIPPFLGGTIGFDSSIDHSAAKAGPVEEATSPRGLSLLEDAIHGEHRGSANSENHRGTDRLFPSGLPHVHTQAVSSSGGFLIKIVDGEIV